MKPGASKGKEPQTAAKERNQAEWDMHIAAAANLQRLQGKMPAGLERVFQEVLVPAVDWKDKIRALFARKLGTGSYDWKKPDRRLIVRDIYTPARSGYGAGTVVVGVDTSGSISSKEVDMFLAEVGGILEDVKPRELHLCWCDAALHRTDICDSPSDLYVIRAKGAPGGGGTSFKPVFDYVADNDLRPDCIVYLTDGHGDFPSYKPECPMIWASIDKKEYPWGDVVMIPKQARD
jgi:predicted metal-dependent peptidase